jgi:hypothetical protein
MSPPSPGPAPERNGDIVAGEMREAAALCFDLKEGLVCCLQHQLQR